MRRYRPGVDEVRAVEVEVADDEVDLASGLLWGGRGVGRGRAPGRDRAGAAAGRPARRRGGGDRGRAGWTVGGAGRRGGRRRPRRLAGPRRGGRRRASAGGPAPLGSPRAAGPRRGGAGDRPRADLRPRRPPDDPPVPGDRGGAPRRPGARPVGARRRLRERGPGRGRRRPGCGRGRRRRRQPRRGRGHPGQRGAQPGGRGGRRPAGRGGGRRPTRWLRWPAGGTWWWPTSVPGPWWPWPPTSGSGSDPEGTWSSAGCSTRRRPRWPRPSPRWSSSTSAPSTAGRPSSSVTSTAKDGELVSDRVAPATELPTTSSGTANWSVIASLQRRNSLPVRKGRGVRSRA